MEHFDQRVPPAPFCRIVSSKRMTPLINSPNPRRREEKFAESPTVLLGANGTEGFETLLDRAGALFSGENSLSASQERLGCGLG